MAEDFDENQKSIDLQTLISGLISNPEALSKISNIISQIEVKENSPLSPTNDEILSNNQENSNHFQEENTESSISSPTFTNFDISNFISKMPNIVSKLSSASSENSIINKQQIALLLAVRPYLSERRKELIDTFIKMNKLGAIFMNFTKEGEKNVLQ